MLFLINLIKLLFLSSFILSAAHADSLSQRVIRSGRHSGKKLINVVEAYTIQGKNSSTREDIPSSAIESAFNFYDRYNSSPRRFETIGVNSHRSKVGIQYLGGAVSRSADTIENDNYIVIFDLNLHSSLKRLHVIDVRSGEINSYEASHGLGSDCGTSRPGYACRFSNSVNGNATPLGFFTTGQLYNSEKHGGAVTMTGLEKSSNGFSGNDEPTTVVIHSASYVYSGHAGRSNGCVAVSESNISWIRNNIKGGVLFYFYHSSLDYNGRNPIVSGLSVNTVRKSSNIVEQDEGSADDRADGEPNYDNDYDAEDDAED